MLVTVAVCTWNRAALLRQTLEWMTRLVIPDGVEWELLVVNNGCTDGTDAVLASFAERLPLRRLYEPRLGLSYARNAAVRAAVGKYIVWTDDDVLVDAGWLASYADAFVRWPSAGVLGGPIRPLLAGTPPDWLVRVLPKVGSAFAARDLGRQPVALEADLARIPYGANYVVRTREQRSHPYHAALGRRGRALAFGGEETEVLCALLRAGVPGRWVPCAHVRHYIDPPRQTVQYLRSYFTAYGEYLAWRAWRGDRVSEPRVTLWRRAVVAEGRFRLMRRALRPERWIDDLIVASESWGELRGRRSPPVHSR